MDTLRRKKLLQILGIAGAVACLALLLVLSATRPSTEQETPAALQQTLMTDRFRDMSENEKDAVREQWRQLSPETRQEIFTGVARQRLDDMRRATAGLTPEQRVEHIRGAIRDMRRHREALSAEERKRIRERLNSPEAQEMVRYVMGFYQTELTARERAELDPLLHEWLAQLERMLR